MIDRLMEYFNRQPRLEIIILLAIILALMATAAGQENAEGWQSMQGANAALILDRKMSCYGRAGQF